VIVLAGIAGLLAGAFSMGVGEYISVQSQQELLAYQTDLQRRQLVEVPEQERAILISSYVSKGFSQEEASAFADRVFQDMDHAVSLMLHTEVGLDARSIGSPLAAAGGSFLAFTLGALIPLAPYLLMGGQAAFVTSLGISLVALAMLGAGISMLTRKSLPYAAVRQVLLGGAAAAVTYGVGALVGVSAA
jgi:VIT1/CCC1 family predicted Fe2+/Mn2+ transporter